MRCGLWLVLPALAAALKPISYHNYRLYRFSHRNYFLEVVQKEFEEDGHRLTVDGERMPIVDVLKENGKTAHVVVAPEIAEEFEDLARRFNIDDLKLMSKDIQEVFTMEKQNIVRQRRANLKLQKRKRRHIHGNRLLDTDDFHRYPAIVRYLRLLNDKFPDRVTFLNISKTFENRDLVGIKVINSNTETKLFKISSPNSVNKSKPAVFIDAGIHAREWIAPAVALYMVDKLVFDYDNNETIKWMVDEFDWYIIPVANPDGYEYSMTKDRLWRKTRSKNSKVNKWCVGADANRNWGYRWGEAGANRSPCSNIYAGAEPFSEPEVIGLKEFIQEHVGALKIYASLHAYGQVFLSPWGYTSQKPDNYRDQAAAAKYAIDAIKDLTGANYTFGSIAEVMYPASGTSIDYMQNLGVPFIYGIELRPEDIEQSNGFAVDPAMIHPTGAEMMASFTKIAMYVQGRLPKPARFKSRRH